MEYPNSRLAGPSPYDITVGNLCCGIPVRVHRNAELADRGALRAQKTWQNLFGSLPAGFSGTMSPRHNFVATCLPETLPDRLEILGYTMEIVNLVDDMIDESRSPMAALAPHMADLLQAYSVVMAGGDMDGVSCSPLAKVVIDFGKAMVAIDPVRAKEVFRWGKKWARLMLSRSGDGKDCRDFDEYLEYRRVDVCAHAAFGLFMFAMGLDIPEDQQQTCLELSESFWIQTSLVNDYYSWEREHQAASDHHHTSVTNAIWVLMEKHSMSCDEAKAVCRERIRQYAAEYLQVLETVKARDDLCRDAKFLLDVQKFAISGNAAWSVQCYRYHPEQEFIPAHVEMAKAVWADETTGLDVVPKQLANGTALRDETKPNGIVVKGSTEQDMAAVRDVPALGTKTLEAPSQYLDSLPAKGIRDKTIDALNMWYNVSPDDTFVIKTVVDLLHGASLMLDDIEDSSHLRRGKPAVHMVFGTMQTINSAGYRFLGALTEVRKLDSELCMDIFCRELQDLYIGQSHDLSWTYNLDCPTEEEYLSMVDYKTAGLFRMLARLMDAKSASPTKPDVTLLARFMTLLGRLFQIRDDYMNLTSADYTKQKGFCEDLDEGKYSLPLIHALGRCETFGPTHPKDNTILRNLLSQRHVAGRMSLEQKQLFLEHLKEQGSLEYTRHALDALQMQLTDLAQQMGMLENEMLKALLEALKV